MTFELRVHKNLSGVVETLDCEEHYTRLYPHGGDRDGHHLSMASALHPVTAIDTSGPFPILTLGPTFGKDPILLDRQLDGLLVQPQGSTSIYPIRNSYVATQQVELDVTWHASIVSVGELVYIRERDPCDPNKWRELVWLQDPDAVDEFGLWEAPYPRLDILPVDNIHPDPFLEGPWTLPVGGMVGSDLPDGWSKLVGFESTLQTTDPTRRRLGNYSLLVNSFGGTGIVSDWVDIYPTPDRPFFSFQIALMLLRGVVRLSVEVDLIGDASLVVEVPDPATTPDNAIPRTSQLHVWVERLGIADQRFNFWEEGAKRYRLKIYKEGANQAIWWLDAVQVLQQHIGAEVFWGGRASNEVWHAANEGLTVYAQPKRSYDVSLLDIHRRDLTGRDLLRQGSAGRVVHPDLGIREDVRVVPISRHLYPERAADTTIRLANRRDELTREQLRRRVLSHTVAPEPIATGEEPSSTKAGHISMPRASMQTEGSVDYLHVEYDHNDAGAGGFYVDISSAIDGVVATDRDVTTEYTGGDSIDRYGSFRWAIPVGVAGVDTWVTDTITVELKEGIGGTVVATRKTTFAYWRA